MLLAGTGLTVQVRGTRHTPYEVMVLSRSRIASAEIAQRRKEAEHAAAEARRAERARQKIRAEESTRQYFADRAADARHRTRRLEARVEELRTILERGRRRAPRIDLGGLREQFQQPAPDLSSVGWRPTPPDWSRYEPPPPSVLDRVAGAAARHRRQLEAARAAYGRAVADHERAEAERQRRFADARQRYAAQLAQERLRVDEHNRAVDAFAAALRRREPDAVGGYLRMVLDAVPLPRDFPRAVAVDGSVVRFRLPGPEVVPAARAVRYDEATDELREIPRPAAEIATLHRLVVAQVVLLCLRDVFAADPGLDLVTFQGQGVDVRVGRGVFEGLLARGSAPEIVLDELRTSLRRAS
jgi:restriction system protein